MFASFPVSTTQLFHTYYEKSWRVVTENNSLRDVTMYKAAWFHQDHCCRSSQWSLKQLFTPHVQYFQQSTYTKKKWLRMWSFTSPLPPSLPPSLQKLCDYVCDLLLEESNVQPVSTPITVCGDIHGQVHNHTNAASVAYMYRKLRIIRP